MDPQNNNTVDLSEISKDEGDDPTEKEEDEKLLNTKKLLKSHRFSIDDNSKQNNGKKEKRLSIRFSNESENFLLDLNALQKSPRDSKRSSERVSDRQKHHKKDKKEKRKSKREDGDKVRFKEEDVKKDLEKKKEKKKSTSKSKDKKEQDQDLDQEKEKEKEEDQEGKHQENGQLEKESKNDIKESTEPKSPKQKSDKESDDSEIDDEYDESGADEDDSELFVFEGPDGVKLINKKQMPDQKLVPLTSFNLAKQLNRTKSIVISRRDVSRSINEASYDLEKIINLQRLVRWLVIKKRLHRLVSTFCASEVSSERIRLRNEALKEVLVSEEAYVDNIRTICEMFYKPFYQASLTEDPPLTSFELRVIFGNILSIYEAHVIFLDQLRKRLETWPKIQYFGDIFHGMESRLYLYMKYILNFDSSTNMLLKCRQRPSFTDLIKQCGESERTNGLFLNSFLITPVQRLPRYQMLIQGILNYTDKEHMDYENLTLGLEKIKTVLNEINKQKAIHETLRKQLDRVKFPNERIERLLYKKGNSVVHEGMLKEIVTISMMGSQNKTKKHHYILLKERDSSFSQKKSTNENGGFWLIKSKKKEKNSLIPIVVNKSPARSTSPPSVRPNILGGKTTAPMGGSSSNILAEHKPLSHELKEVLFFKSNFSVSAENQELGERVIVLKGNVRKPFEDEIRQMRVILEPSTFEEKMQWVIAFHNAVKTSTEGTLTDSPTEQVQRDIEPESNEIDWDLEQWFTPQEWNLLLIGAKALRITKKGETVLSKAVANNQERNLPNLYKVKSGVFKKLTTNYLGKVSRAITHPELFGEEGILQPRKGYQYTIVSDSDEGQLLHFHTPFLLHVLQVDHNLAKKFYHYLATKMSGLVMDNYTPLISSNPDPNNSTPAPSGVASLSIPSSITTPIGSYSAPSSPAPLKEKRMSQYMASISLTNSSDSDSDMSSRKSISVVPEISLTQPKDSEFRILFSLSDDHQTVLKEYECQGGYNRKYTGTLYLSQTYLCFASLKPLKKKIIDFANVTSVEMTSDTEFRLVPSKWHFTLSRLDLDDIKAAKNLIEALWWCANKKSGLPPLLDKWENSLTSEDWNNLFSIGYRKSFTQNSLVFKSFLPSSVPSPEEVLTISKNWKKPSGEEAKWELGKGTLFHVLRGKCIVRMSIIKASSRKRDIERIVGCNAAFGELSFFRRRPIYHAIASADDVEILAIPMSLLEIEFQKSRGFQARFYKFLAINLSVFLPSI
eukprot:TRINITY_DN7861_c0_g1_i1.p1 TRINITY_DN7861_c0_g1~~TRINITY_DN7861_c0_g1_i1.p1  ORF type:complete len:1380 (+),score=336.05 TRINITY_DN7861_c0_g1_i1:421-4140(+)